MWPPNKDSTEHTCSVVIPVYRGEHTLTPVLEELRPLTDRQCTPGGRAWRLAEVVLVHDGGPDRSDVVIRRLASVYSFVRPVWLSRNFGQHAATVAGMSSTGSDWIATIDEDGQFDPNDIGLMLDVALDRHAQLVYATPTHPPPHGRVRNLSSSLAKGTVTRLLAARDLPRFSSFRFMIGDIGRGVAAYMGPGVYLDVALTWVFGRIESFPTTFREEYTRPSGYSYRSLLSHFWQLVISAGTRPLRLVSLVGATTTVIGAVLALVILIGHAVGEIDVQGYTSLMIVLLLLGGAILFSLGVIAEYVGAAVRMAMGKPLYLITSDPGDGPLHRDDRFEADHLAAN
jgi:polyisoprenyl-phosphate glycosyltransferase